MSSKYKAAIFDLDGTLLDTLADIGTAANDVLRQQGFPVHPLPDYRTFVGDGVATLFSRILPTNVCSDELISQCVSGFSETYSKRWNEQTKLYPGIPELLDELTQRGVPIAVLSNKPHEFVARCLAEFLPHWTFDPAFGQREGVPKKPDPAGVNDVCDVLSVTPAECVYIGDSNVDILTGKNSGALAVGVSWGFRPVEELLDHGADRILNTPSDLLELFIHD